MVEIEQVYGERISGLEFSALGFDELVGKLEAVLPPGDLKDASINCIIRSKEYAREIANGDYYGG